MPLAASLGPPTVAGLWTEALGGGRGSRVPGGWRAVSAATLWRLNNPLLSTAEQETNAALQSLHASANPRDVSAAGARVMRPISSWQPSAGAPVAPGGRG